VSGMGGEKLSEKIKRASFYLILITLVVNIILTGVNVYLIGQSYQIRQVSLDFQCIVCNATPIIIAWADDADLEKPIIYIGHDGIIEQTTHYGTLYATCQVLAPLYGGLFIKLKNFEANESEYLSSERLNETKISLADEENYIYMVCPGLNEFHPQLRLEAQVHPNPEKFPPKGESVQFFLGRLVLEAELLLFDIQNTTTVTKEISAKIFVTLEMSS